MKLPRIHNPPELGTSRNLAMRRYLQNDRSLNKKGKSAEFNKALSEYLQLEHAEVVPEQEMANTHYYLPVHGVFKSTSTTTKVRPVFDASAPSSNGVSLNDQLLQGPNLYPLLSDVLLRFRTHPIGFSADISKMFREIKLHPDEKDFHRFLWRDNENILDLRMNRLTFGVRSSPYIATQVIRHLAQTYSSTHPDASQAILRSFYIDDYLSGANTLEEAVHIRTQLCDLLSKAGMTLRKWRSNSEQFRGTIPPEIVETENLQISPADKPIKALGIHWDVANDNLTVAVPEIPADQPVTKRTIASNLGKVFDILGFFSPVTISGKIMLKKLWQHQTSWDTPAPDVIKESWQRWITQLPAIGSHVISRKYTLSTECISQSLHGFSDASQEAYGAVVYIQQTAQDGSSRTSIVISKARVIPLKGLTTPRAELAAALTLAKLLCYCSSLLDINTMTAWSDSSIVLCWLRKSPNALNSFVSNRVRSIQQLLPDVSWRHVASASNPADLLSRGLPASELIPLKLWWEGPPWLRLPPHQWPKPQFTVPQVLPEIKTVILIAPPTQQRRLWDDISNFDHLVRIATWIRRFCSNSKLSSDKRNLQSIISSQEYDSTKQHLILQSQKETFPEAFKAIERKASLPKGHSLSSFTLTQTRDGTLLIATRIRNPREVNNQKTLTPMSLKSTLTQNLLHTLHLRHLHPGVNTMLAIVGSSFHIPGVKNFIKGISRKCPKCQRAYERGSIQSMGLLPSVRTTPAPPFSHSGLDFAGPFLTKRGYTRRPVIIKTYACLFTCLSTRATHIELCLDLSTDEFMAALRRFCARRGTPTEIFSDNGSNFIGAHNELQQVNNLLRSSKTSISHFACTANITWHHIPPRSPHMGGAWEAAIKQMKILMRKIIRPHILKVEELTSVLIEIEAIMNSRPIVPLDSTDPDSLVLTPGHFLIGRPLLAPPTTEASQSNISTLRRWQLVQRLTKDIWKQWKSHYLKTLQGRQKWNSAGHNFKVGEVVFVKDDIFAHRKWPLARITATYPGSDGVVRVVDFECQGKKFQRSTHSIINFMDEPCHSAAPPPQSVQVRQQRTEQV